MSEANQLCGWLYETIHGADFPLEQWRSRFQDLMSRRPPRRVLGRLLNIAVQSTRLDCVTDLLRAGSGIDTDGGGPAIDVVVGDLYDLRVHGDIERETDRVLGMCRLLIEWGADPWVEVNDAYGFATSSAAERPCAPSFGSFRCRGRSAAAGRCRHDANRSLGFQTLIRRLDARSMEAGEATDPPVLESVINAGAMAVGLDESRRLTASAPWGSSRVLRERRDVV